jgi:drug/metabolite transporter (DMT)-like permease
MKVIPLRWIFLLLLALIWGSSFILIKKALVGLSPIQVGSLRIVFCAIFMLLIGSKTLPTIPHTKWKNIAVTSLFGTFIPAFLFAIAQTQISSSVSSILNSLTPLSALILGALLFNLEVRRTQLLGVLIGLIGTVILIVNGMSTQPGQNYYYAFFVVIATICYAINVNLIKKYLSDTKPLAITTGNFLVIFIPALVILVSTGFFTKLNDEALQHSLLFVMILGVIGTGIANVVFYKLIQISSPVFATQVTYLIPIVAFFWGLLDAELLTIYQLIGAFIILMGVYLTGKK